MTSSSSAAQDFLALSDTFEQSICEIPTKHNRLRTLLSQQRTSLDEIDQHARSIRVALHSRLVPCMQQFLQYQSTLTHTSLPVHRAFFAALLAQPDALTAFTLRLVKQRPVAFLTSSDHALLRNGRQASDRDAFTRIGTLNERPGLALTDYICYAEMILSSLLLVSSYTHFINSGSRSNCGRVAPIGSFVPQGIYIAAVGARFEREDQMETLFVVVSPNRSTEANGYGAQADPNGVHHGLLQVFAPLYGLTHFPSWQEAIQHYTTRSSDADSRYSRIGGELFDRTAFRARIRLTLDSILLEADSRASDVNRQAFVYLVGLGLGVWAITKREQCVLFLDELARAIAHNVLSNVGDVYIAWFPPETQQCGTASDGGTLFDSAGHAITIRFGNADPADRMPDDNSLLVATFAWDGNSFPGNEYWMGSLAASGDPAAACCSTIPEIQNAWINPHFDSAHVVVLEPTTTTQ